MDYTQFVVELISIILQDNSDLSVCHIALDEEDLKYYHSIGYTPQRVYFEEWERDAGHYFGV